MGLREKATAVANDAKEQVEAGNIVLDTGDAMAYAIVLILAAISEQLQTISEQLPGGSYYAEYK